MPLKIVLTPAPTTAAGVVRRLAGEALVFRSLFAADRSLWVAAWVFHLSLVMLAVGHIGGLVVPGFAQTSLGLTEEQFHRMAQVTGGVFGILAVVPLLYLLLRRLVMERLRYLSTLSDYLALALLLLVIATGNQMRFIGASAPICVRCADIPSSGTACRRGLCGPPAAGLRAAGLHPVQ